MSNPRRQQQQQSSGFRSGPIRSVGGGGPPSLSSGLAVNRNSGAGGGTASLGSSSAARPNNNTAPAMTTAAPAPSVPRHPYDVKAVQQSYDPFAQQQRNVSYNISNVAAAPPASALSSHQTNFTPDNSAQLQPHIVSLPPSPAPQPPIMQQQAASSSTTASSAPPFQHPLQPQNTQSLQQQQQQGLYQARSHPAAANTAQINQQHQQQQSFAYSQQQYNQSPQTQQQHLSNQTMAAYQQQQAYQQQPSTSTTQHQQQQQQQSMYNQNQTQQQQPQQQRKKQPTTPDEDLDAFLSSPSGIMTLTRPRPLPSTNGVLSKSKLLASRRAWGDVIRVTNDALIVRNMDGGGGVDVGKHHSYYSEIVACAKASGPSSPTKMSHSVTAATETATNTNSSSSSKASSPNEIDEIQKLRRETCELIVLRFIAHLKLRRYVDLGKEISMLGLMPFLPDNNQRRGVVDDDNNNSNEAGNDEDDNSDERHLAWKEGSIHSTDPQDKLPFWVPYGLRILAAQQLQYNDGSSKALDVLLDMRDRATRTEYWNSGGMEVWKSTIDNAIVNTCIRMREWRLALYYLEEMINGLHEGVDREVHWWCCQESLGGSIGEETRSQLRELITSAAYVELLSRQILILLQSGAITAAEAVQGEVSTHAAKVEGIVFTGALSRIHTEFALIRQVPVRKMTNDGLISFAQSDYELAAKHFRGALKIQDKISSAAEIDSSSTSSSSTDDVPSPPGYPSWKDLDTPTLGFDADASLSVDCINNLSLCLLCTGNMRAAVQEMETLIRKDPCANLTEGLAFNLCTLYELSSDGEECTRRKKRLQRVSKRFFLHDIGVESFRLN